MYFSFFNFTLQHHLICQHHLNLLASVLYILIVLETSLDLGILLQYSRSLQVTASALDLARCKITCFPDLWIGLPFTTVSAASNCLF
jgi:hypothetical protein